MSSAAPSRWTEGAMQKRIASRYAAERRFRSFGLAAIGISVAFLAFLLLNMTWEGAGGFVRTEAKLTIDFPRSDLILDPATLRGPQAKETVASAGLEGVLGQAAVQQFGEGAEELVGGATVRALGEKLIADPNLLTRKAELWLPVSAKADVAEKGDGEAAIEALVAKADTRRTFNLTFLTASDATDPSVVGVWGSWTRVSRALELVETIHSATIRAGRPRRRLHSCPCPQPPGVLVS